MIHRYHARVTNATGRSFDLWLSARTQQALEAAMAEVIGYITEASE